MADWTPQSRAEEILFNTINGEPYDGLPQSRIEELLLELKDVIESGGGGGGGTDNYNSLKNLPQINGQTVKGNMSGTTLGLVNMVMGKDLSTNDYTNADKAIVDSVTADLADKVDKVIGKGLSENDYTDADKAIVDGVTSALAGKVDKVTGKGLSSNDYTNADKAIVDGVTSALAGKVDTSSVGSANGVAELDANGRVPSSQLPSYVDDTIEGYLNSVDGKFYVDSSYTTEITGETGKIYVTLDTDKTYRWSGSGFVEISESLALGETSSTAYAGNKGKANADAIAGIKNGTSINSFSAVETALSGKANSSDLGDKSNLTTTDKSSAVAAINELAAIILGDGSGIHNALYRGKNLGTSFTAAQSTAIRDGSFKDLYVGDYWTINDTVYRIADFDYFLRSGDTECTTHHVVIVPDRGIDSAQMNTSDDTTGAYVGSDMYTTHLATAKSIINTDFGSAHVLSHREFLANAVTNGKQSDGAWYDSTVELMTESMVYGGSVFAPGCDGSTVPALYAIGCKQLNLFRHRPDLISNHQTYWLRDVVSAFDFADVFFGGYGNFNSASQVFGVRPYFCIY